MDCPECGTYNPEDREVCWRCNTPLPERQPVTRRDPQRSARIWLYVAVGLFAVVTLLRMCGVSTFLTPPAIEAPTGSYPGDRPAYVYQVADLEALL